MLSLHRIVPLLTPLLLAPAASARVVERLDLRKMVERTDAAILGTILEVTATEVTIDGSIEVYTHVRVRGENLYSGREEEIVVSFLGGRTDKGEARCAESPTQGETRIGKRVLVFSKWSPVLGGTGLHGLYAGHGGL
ncbi:MAG TPA: hypothetical protein VKF62_00660, partial [Planctomycetota bacterium]|nr:hypothetical protein [Planctomycetota bacterium]